MGSIAQNPLLPTHGEGEKKKEITVLVTGFGPFRAEFPINPSWEIARGLPPFLRPLSTVLDEKNGKGESGAEGGSRKGENGIEMDLEFPVVRILVHPKPVHVGYEAVRKLIPELWDPSSTITIDPTGTSNADESNDGGNGGSERRIDYTIHVGMAGGRDYYSIERRGHRDGYDMKDVDGRFVEGWADDWYNAMAPHELQTDIAIDKVGGIWRKAMGLENHDLRISEDAGRYLCDFIYYTSLNYLWSKKEERRVLFLHVPVDSDETAIKNGVKILEELIRAVVLVGEREKGEKKRKEK